jgi:hypothetical protein
LEDREGIFQTYTSDWGTVREYSKRGPQIGGQGGNIPNGDVRLGDSEGIFQIKTSDWGTVREYSKWRRQIGGQ